MTQAATAFNFILSALALIVLQLQQLTNLVASIQRLGGLTERLRQIEAQNIEAQDIQGTRIERREGEHIEIRNLTLMTPTQDSVLVRDLSVTVEPGRSLLIMGRSGIGKSSLLRAIAGLWNQGSGQIITPPRADLMFLPQRPYLIDGSLRQQLSYPASAEAFGDEPLVHALEQVNLAYLLERLTGLDADTAALKLSGGEQQRLAVARLLLRAPKYAILDEATSALDLKNENLLYRALLETGATMVSVGHRQSLMDYHPQVLEL